MDFLLKHKNFIIAATLCALEKGRFVESLKAELGQEWGITNFVRIGRMSIMIIRIAPITPVNQYTQSIKVIE